MTIHTITSSNPLWLAVADYAEICSWDACKRMASFMREDKFNDWERIFIAEESGEFMGFCALGNHDEYNPLIKWVFVDEKYRGQRLSQKLIDTAADYAKSIGFTSVFLTTWHIGLYERYGFVKLCDKEMRPNYYEGVYNLELELNRKSIPYQVIDVFTDKLFKGNPAGVCLLDSWLSDDILQSIAMENNLSETAFIVKSDGYYELRWFTPAIEVDLCGHATLASAFVLFDDIEKTAHTIQFKTMSGMLSVSKVDDLLYLDFPSRPVVPCPMYQTFEKSLGIKPVAVYKAADFLVLVDSEETLRNLNLDFALLKQIKHEAGIDNDSFGIIVTAAGGDCDFVSRFFAPNAGIDEDPVTGRAHCSLIPFWSRKLGKTTLTAKQLSKRGGVLSCEDCGERVKIGGKAVRYLKGELI